MERDKEKLRILDWSQAQDDILEEIWKRLTIPQQAVVSTVCKAWHSSTSNKASIWSPDTPWLITGSEASPQFKFLSITNQRHFNIDKSFPPVENTYTVGSCKGWLIIQSKDEIFILNLFSKLRIDLPPWTAAPDFAKSAAPAIFTMSTCAKLNPITIAGITYEWKLVWCNVGDKEWKCYRSDEYYFNVAFRNDQLYAVDPDGDRVDIFRVDNDKHELILQQTICATIPTVSQSDNFNVSLVESKENIFVVKRYCDSGSSIRRTIGFDIFKVQERISGDSPHQLVNVESLEDEVFFLSGLFSESLPAKYCPGLVGDSIYFIGDHTDIYFESELGAFPAGEGNICIRPMPHSSINSPIWLLPRYAFTCNCKCHPSNFWRSTN